VCFLQSCKDNKKAGCVPAYLIYSLLTNLFRFSLVWLIRRCFGLRFQKICLELVQDAQFVEVLVAELQVFFPSSEVPLDAVVEVEVAFGAEPDVQAEPVFVAAPPFVRRAAPLLDPPFAVELVFVVDQLFVALPGLVCLHVPVW